jgi:hypothetical protein
LKKLLVLLTLVSATAFGQHRLVSSSPASGTSGVASHLTLELTFNAALDSTQTFSNDAGYFTNIDSISLDHYSTDKNTVFIKGVCRPDSVSFFAGYSWKFSGGAKLDTPFVVLLTAGGSFIGNTVSGTITSVVPGVSPGGALVLLATAPITGGEQPSFFTGTVSLPGGSFSIPWVPYGTWYPVTAVDVNKDANIDPSGGDAIAVGNGVLVNNSNVSNVALQFGVANPFCFAEAIDSVNTIVGQLPSDHVLRSIQTYNADSTGRSQEWEFKYTSASAGQGYKSRVSHFGLGTKTIDAIELPWVQQLKPIGNPALAALADSVVARAERNGGKEFRHTPVSDTLHFQLELTLGDLKFSDFSLMVPDQSKLYWGVKYAFYNQVASDSSSDVLSKKFICDFTTGAILGATGVSESGPSLIPETYSLFQNYPNPFNPSTIISFDLPLREDVKLTVYSLLGQEIATLVNGIVPAGRHEVRFDGSKLSSGVYFFRLSTPHGNFTKSMVLAK